MGLSGASLKYWLITAFVIGAGIFGLSCYLKNWPSPLVKETDSFGALPVTTEKELPEETVPAPSSLESGISANLPVQAASSSDPQLTPALQSADTPTAAPPKQSGQIDLSVPFSSQAPLFNWDDARQQDGCEEAAALMAKLWVKGEAGGSPANWEQQITALADFQQEKYREHRDVSVEDVISRIFNDYFSYQKVRKITVDEVGDILAELEQGNLVLAPANGQALQNPHYTPPGPAHHFLVIKGYDYERDEFITNDPGTRLGAGYRYPAETLIAALRAYPTGYHGQYETERKTAIVVEK